METISFLAVLVLFFLALWLAEVIFFNCDEMPVQYFVLLATITWILSLSGGVLVSYLISVRTDSEWGRFGPQASYVLPAYLALLLFLRQRWMAPAFFAVCLSFCTGYIAFF
jgi:hypothetical protein